tara:strand:+ start:81 stop:464 length:384 start_codon:yes stop_codon:yes gene_type:complete
MTVDSSGQVTIRGEGSATTTNLQQGLIKVWMQYNSDGNSIYDSFNTSSVTDLATGNPRNSFTNVMGNDDYCLQGACGYGYSMCFEDNEGEKSGDTNASYIDLIFAFDTSSGAVDQTVMSMSVVGDLA